MSLWQNLQRLLGLARPSNHLSLEMDQNLIRSLERLAQREQRPETELAAELLSMALAQRKEAEINLRHWEALSPREQQVTALICLGYTNPQIAARLMLSLQTVKTHVRNVLYKFDLRSKIELRHLLADWDFSAWRDRDS
jgi:DNA-binding NarL/FixJ family response regulator